LTNELLIKGKEAYKKGNYKDAEQFYKKVIEDPDQYNKRCALINLNVLYGEASQEFSKSVEVNQKLLEIDNSSEAKTNLAESLLRDRKYEEARKYALEVVNASRHDPGERDKADMLYPDHLDEKGYKTINTFFTLCSYLLEGSDNFKIPDEKWLFAGLAKSINDSNASDKTKKALLAVIDSFKM
jgi:tetratricopeptide (TPR) repeat protein